MAFTATQDVPIHDENKVSSMAHPDATTTSRDPKMPPPLSTTDNNQSQQHTNSTAPSFCRTVGRTCFSCDRRRFVPSTTQPQLLQRSGLVAERERRQAAACRCEDNQCGHCRVEKENALELNQLPTVILPPIDPSCFEKKETH